MLDSLNQQVFNQFLSSQKQTQTSASVLQNQTQNNDVVEIGKNLNNTVNGKQKNILKIAGITAGVAAVAVGILYAIKHHKIKPNDVENITNKAESITKQTERIANKAESVTKEVGNITNKTETASSKKMLELLGGYEVPDEVNSVFEKTLAESSDIRNEFLEIEKKAEGHKARLSELFKQYKEGSLPKNYKVRKGECEGLISFAKVDENELIKKVYNSDKDGNIESFVEVLEDVKFPKKDEFFNSRSRLSGNGVNIYGYKDGKLTTYIEGFNRSKLFTRGEYVWSDGQILENGTLNDYIYGNLKLEQSQDDVCKKLYSFERPKFILLDAQKKAAWYVSKKSEKADFLYKAPSDKMEVHLCGGSVKVYTDAVFDEIGICWMKGESPTYIYYPDSK